MESETVSAKKIEYLLQFFDEKGDVVSELKKLKDESVDLIVTSPPYNLKNSTGNGMKDGRGGKWSKAALINGYKDYDDNMPHHLYVEWQRECLTQMYRVLKEDGAIFYNHKWRVQGGLLQDRQDITVFELLCPLSLSILSRVHCCGSLTISYDNLTVLLQYVHNRPHDDNLSITSLYIINVVL